MASNLKLVGGSPLIGSPLIYAVTAAALTGEVSFHKLKLEVTAGLLPAYDDRVINDEIKLILTFSSPVNSGETLQIDISSALRAAADSYHYAVTPPSAYPCIKFSLKAWDEYMQNGTDTQKTGVITNEGGTAIMGSFSDLERLLANGNKAAQVFSRKPTADLNKGIGYEVVVDGETVVVPENWDKGLVIGNITAGPTSQVFTVSVTDNELKNGAYAIKSYGGKTFWVYSKKFAKRFGDRYCFRFVNTLGVLESIAVNCLTTQQMNLESEKHIVSMPETFSKFSHGIYEKSNDYEKLKLSTGPLDKYWTSWFLHEFLTTKCAWVQLDSNWIPCHIVVEDTVTGCDRTKSDAISVDFTVELDMNGSPLNLLTI